MDLSELNNQLNSLQFDFQNNDISQNNINTNNTNNTMNQDTHLQMKKQLQNQFPNQQDINFKDIKNNIDTTQIKRPTKSGDHRNDINEKMNMLNVNFVHPENTNPNSPDMLNRQSMSQQTQYSKQQAPIQQSNENNFQQTRNNSNYINNMNNLQPSQSRSPQIEPTNQNNHFSTYYNNNFETLQTQQKQKQNNLQYSSLDDMFQNQNQNQYQHQNTQNTQETHNNGMNMLNVRNMYNMNNNTQTSNQNNMTNKINDTGFHRKEEKKTDYRQNMNTKLDNMIFNNPNASPMNPILQQSHNFNNNSNNNNNIQKDTRMVIQDSNKDYYRQSSNDRMSQYSPLSRAANIPIHMANMSVNDFYSSMNPGGDFKTEQKIINEENSKLNSKEMLNNRINNYSPLAKTIQYQSNQENKTNQSNQTHQTHNSNHSNQKPKQWNPNDVNTKLNNVVYNQLPVISNSENI